MVISLFPEVHVRMGFRGDIAERIFKNKQKSEFFFG